MKSVRLKSGKYVVAVSGGVDSMSLAHMLHTNYGSSTHTFVLAHFNHGIRSDSDEDQAHVRNYAAQLKLPFVYDRVRLDAQASEEVARNARYRFLRMVKQSAAADAILTAHHKDDALETAVFNLLRGTGRQGVMPFCESPGILRPLLGFSKSELYEYARANHIPWREDSTNRDTAYRRNYIRHTLLPRATPKTLAALKSSIGKVYELSQRIDALLDDLMQSQLSTNQLDRQQYIALPHTVARELLVVWLRKNGVREFDRKTIERLSVAIKTAASGTKHDVGSGYYLLLDPGKATILPPQEKKSSKIRLYQV